MLTHTGRGDPMEKFPKIVYVYEEGIEDGKMLMIFDDVRGLAGFCDDGDEVGVYELKEIKRASVNLSLE